MHARREQRGAKTAVCNRARNASAMRRLPRADLLQRSTGELLPPAMWFFLTHSCRPSSYSMDRSCEQSRAVCMYVPLAAGGPPALYEKLARRPGCLISLGDASRPGAVRTTRTTPRRAVLRGVRDLRLQPCLGRGRAHARGRVSSAHLRTTRIKGMDALR